MNLHTYKQQVGVGLIEVMVALLLLAVAVLGFSAMQMTAIKTTDESMMRTRALTVIRGGSEALRANSLSTASFKTAMQSTTVPTTAQIKECMTDGSTVPTACTLSQMATRDARAIKLFAHQNDLKISLHTCPTITAMSTGLTRECFIASWGDTEPEFSAAANACAKANGTYNVGAKCFVMEAY